jgi:putative two-component system response regulator
MIPQKIILVVDDSPQNIQAITAILKADFKVKAATTGEKALALAAQAEGRPDLILLDVMMPGMDGNECCRLLKADATTANIPVIFLTAKTEAEAEAEGFGYGAVDYLHKPFNPAIVRARVRTQLALRDAQLQLENQNQQLEERVQEQLREISESHHATILALTSLAESRDDDTGNHIVRVQGFCKILAQRLAELPRYAPIIGRKFVDNLAQASPLHDIGKVGIPDSVLLKPGPLQGHEVAIMQAHTIIGASTLEAVREHYPHNALLNMGIAIARSHHEHWDGSGYPDGLAGEAIPLPARLLNVADQYDALRSVRPYKRALEHAEAYAVLTEGDGRTKPDHFDPHVLHAFKDCAQDFALLYDNLMTRPSPALIAGPGVWQPGP